VSLIENSMRCKSYLISLDWNKKNIF